MTQLDIKYPISPWVGSSFCDLEVPSPNQHSIAHFMQLIEIAMGAPKGGTLSVDGIDVEGHFSPSCIWSSDSKYLALPKWIVGGQYHRHQQFAVYSLEGQKIYVTDSRYSVLQLESFENGVIKGQDSPANNPRVFEFNLSEFSIKEEL